MSGFVRRWTLLACCAWMPVLGWAQQDEPQERLEVRFLLPEPGVPLFDEVDVAVDVQADREIERVELRFDGGLVGVKTSPPWTWTLDVGPRNRERVFYADVVTAGGRSKRAELVAPRFAADEEIDLGLRQLYVTVTDRRDRRVLDLERRDFTILDDGARQQIVTFERGDIPFTAVLLIDGSQSMRGAALDTALQGARRFVHSLRDHDETKIMVFSDRLSTSTRWGGPADGIAEQMATLAVNIDSFGGSAIFDVLHLAMLRAETRQGRRVVIALTDGWDLHSVLQAEQVAETARRMSSLIYVIRRGRFPFRRYHKLVASLPGATTSLSSGSETRLDFQRLEELVKASGGRILDIDTVEEVDGALQEILAELREQYALGFYPSQRRGDGSWHTVEIQLGRGNLDARTRGGYVDD